MQTEHHMARMAELVERDRLEDEAWDELLDTQALRCCDCVACNHYIPEYNPDAKCVVIAAIERIIAIRTGAAS